MKISKSLLWTIAINTIVSINLCWYILEQDLTQVENLRVTMMLMIIVSGISAIVTAFIAEGSKVDSAIKWTLSLSIPMFVGGITVALNTL